MQPEPVDDETPHEIWECPDCWTFIHLHPDPDHDSHYWTRDFVREHEYVHQQQLEAEHSGDRGMLRLALKYPHLHTAIIQIHGPIEDLDPDHREQILRSAGITGEKRKAGGECTSDSIIPEDALVVPQSPQPDTTSSSDT